LEVAVMRETALEYFSDVEFDRRQRDHWGSSDTGLQYMEEDALTRKAHGHPDGGKTADVLLAEFAEEMKRREAA
jgi:hypothetical protein